MRLLLVVIPLLTISIISCNEQAAQEATDQPVIQDVAPPPADPPLAFADTELAYYEKSMGENGFRKFPSEGCEPPKRIAIPKVQESALSGVDIKIQVTIEEKVLGSAPNFNCRYHVVYWVCGPTCKMVAVFDSESGDLVQVFQTAFGAIFSPSSRMLILNPPRNEKMDVGYRESMGEPEFWELQNGSFIQHQ